MPRSISSTVVRGGVRVLGLHAHSFDQAAPFDWCGWSGLSDAGRAALLAADPGEDSQVALFLPAQRGPIHDGHGGQVADPDADGVDVIPLGNPSRDAGGPIEIDIAVFPRPGSAAFLRHAIARAQRSLVPLGTAVLRLDPPMIPPASQLLRRHGFAEIRTREVGGYVILRAELPLYGRLAWA